MSIVKKGVFLGLITWIVAAVPFLFVIKMESFPLLVFPIFTIAIPPLIVLVVHYILKPVPPGEKEINGLRFGASLILVHIFLDFFAMLLTVNAAKSSISFLQVSARNQINTFFSMYIFYFFGILLSWVTGRYEDRKAKS